MLEGGEMGKALGKKLVGRQCILSVLNNVALGCLCQHAFYLDLLQMTLEIRQTGKMSEYVSNIS